MKCAYIFIVCLGLGCGNGAGRENNDAKKMADTAEVQTADESPKAVVEANKKAPKKDTVLWIGEYAQWNLAPGQSFQGNYDSVLQVFESCDKVKVVKVPREQVVFLPNGNCDTSFNSRTQLMEFDRKDPSLPVRKLTQIQVSLSAANTGQKIEFKTPGRVIQLAPYETERLNQALIVHNLKMRQSVMMKKE